MTNTRVVVQLLSDYRRLSHQSVEKRYFWRYFCLPIIPTMSVVAGKEDATHKRSLVRLFRSSTQSFSHACIHPSSHPFILADAFVLLFLLSTMSVSQSVNYLNLISSQR
eukprot:GHVU01119347.1.p2 GENE.GHVU01119347.1~~GHVU01119347.1.p2  ORF type:complete len:109 (-),score=4.60 GHVU01119347.1:378-704(-)